MMRTTTQTRPGTALRHAPVWTGMLLIVAMSWYWLALMEDSMSAMDNEDMAEGTMAMQGSGLGILLATFAMWAIMMVAMMLPAVVPSTVLFSRLAAQRDANRSGRATTMYVLGYSACWIAFAAPAATLQWALTHSFLLDNLARSTSTAMSAAILFAAGLYQFSPLKTACLSKCRSPLVFFMTNWRDGSRGALSLGILHGSYCVGCCWAVMTVMFVVGAMNLVWMGAITVLVLSEKVIPPTWRVDRITGGALLLAGLWIGLGI